MMTLYEGISQIQKLKDQHRMRSPEQVSLGKLNNVRKALGIARECRTVPGANGVALE